MSAASTTQFRTRLLGALIVLSWIMLWLWGQTPYGQHFHHTTAALPLFSVAVGWTLMSIAMMLPTSFPLLGLFHTMLEGRRNRAWLVSLCIGGYLITWMIFGILAHFGVSQVSSLVAGVNFQVGLLFAAGIYQFSPLKHYCLKKCRSPLTFIMSHWHGKNDATESFWLGAHHGLFCIGCCWSLMLLMFVALTVHFLWMLALGTIMAIEKNVVWGNRISAPIGALLILAAVVFRLTA